MVELSSTMIVISALLYTAFMIPVIPEAKKVESPMKAKCLVSGSILASPDAMVIPAPIQRHVSTISRGNAFPSV